MRHLLTLDGVPCRSPERGNDPTMETTADPRRVDCPECGVWAALNASKSALLPRVPQQHVDCDCSECRPWTS